MRVFVGFVFGFCLPFTAAAEDWVSLDEAGIIASLTDRKVHYKGAWQAFLASGRTLYNAGEDSWGYWRAEQGKYCSQWPPGSVWDCYRLDQSVDGTKVRFLDEEGREFVGTFANK